VNALRKVFGIGKANGLHSHRRTPEAVKEAAALAMPLFLDPSLWLDRRTDVTTVRDVDKVSWSTSLRVAVQVDRLRNDFKLDIAQQIRREPLVIPILLKTRQLLTGFELHDHTGHSVPTLTWLDSRPIVEAMLVSTARGIFGATPLNEHVERALRRFGGDIDEVDAAVRSLNDWAGQSPAQLSNAESLQYQAETLLRNYAMQVVLDALVSGFLVMAEVRLRPDATAQLEVTHDNPIVDGMIPLPVGAALSYQFEIRVPSGVIFASSPALRRDDGNDVSEAIPFGTTRNGEVPAAAMKEIESWAEVRGDLLAGFAQNEPRGAYWRLTLKGSVRNAPRSALMTSLRAMSVLAFSIFTGGLLARSLGGRPDETAAPLLAALPAAYFVVLFERSKASTRELVTRVPRNTLLVLVGLTAAGAAVLALSIPGGAPLVGYFGWGWRGFLWAILAIPTLPLSIWALYQTFLVW
jgi:hypothetical protein